MDEPTTEEPRRRRVRRLAPADPSCVIGYIRVSTDEQAVSGLGLAAQRETIRKECERRGWTLCAIYADEGVSGKTAPEARTALAAALGALDRREAGTLVVAKVDRLTRSLGTLCGLLEAADRNSWAFVSLDVAVDTTTPMGRAMAQMAGVFAELERSMIGQRTRDALAVRKAQGMTLGRPERVSDDARTRIRALRSEGMTWRGVADAMNDEHWPTAQRGRWHPNTCRRIALADNEQETAQ